MTDLTPEETSLELREMRRKIINDTIVISQITAQLEIINADDALAENDNLDGLIHGTNMLKNTFDVVELQQTISGLIDEDQE